MGQIALNRLLPGPCAGLVRGITSRGVLLQWSAEWVLFLSHEDWHGPLTLNLPGEMAIWLRECRIGQAVHYQDGSLFFDEGFSLDLRTVQAWQAPPRPTQTLSIRQRQALLGATAARLGRERGFSCLLGKILDLPTVSAQPLPPACKVAWPAIQQLQQAWRTDPDRSMQFLHRLFGLGSGLTPAGDDVILGLLLATARWGQELGVRWSLPVSTWIELAERCTTTLSAALLDCAAKGQADERLVRGLDGLMTGVISPAVCADLFSGWGGSSGIDALLGMSILLLG